MVFLTKAQISNVSGDTATALRCGSGVTACSSSCPNKTSLANSQTKQELRSHRNSTLSVISVFQNESTLRCISVDLDYSLKIHISHGKDIT